jgi:hypothetical protein
MNAAVFAAQLRRCGNDWRKLAQVSWEAITARWNMDSPPNSNAT